LVEKLILSVEDIKNMLDTSEKGWPYNTIDNATIVFKNDPLFAGNIRENLFRERIELFGTMSWSRNKCEITDKDEIHILHYLEKNYRLNNERRIRAGMQIVATENEYHPIREYLKSLKWDGKERVRHGKQRGWTRVATNSGNKDQGFISVEGEQLDIPFESQ